MDADEVLDMLMQSGIGFRLSSEGFRFSVAIGQGAFRQEAGVGNMKHAVEWLAGMAEIMYPQSAFAKWALERDIWKPEN